MNNLNKIFLFTMLKVVLCTKIHTITNLGLPICLNCKHFIEYKNNYPYDSVPDNSFARCKKFGIMDIVTGEITYNYANLCRESEKKCGINGIFYEENKKLK